MPRPANCDAQPVVRVRPIAPACPRFALLPAFPAVARVAYGAPRLARRRNRRVVDAKHEGRAHACAAALSESASAAVQASQRRISQPGVSQRGVSQRGQPMPSATHRGRQLGQMAVAQGLMRCSCAVLLAIVLYARVAPASALYVS